MKRVLPLVIVLFANHVFGQCEFTISPDQSTEQCLMAEEDVVFTDVANNTVTGNDLIKVASNNNWDGDAFSTAVVYDGGYMRTTANETDERRAIGLSTTNDGVDLNSIDYAFYLNNNGTYQIYENGNNVGNFGNYFTGDEFRIYLDNGQVKYLLNGLLVYISTVPPTLPMHVDVSTRDVDATVEDVVIGNYTDGDFSSSSAAPGAGAGPTYQWFLNGAPVGAASTYSNGALSAGDVITCNINPGAGGCGGGLQTSNTINLIAVSPDRFSDFYVSPVVSPTACQRAAEPAIWTSIAQNRKTNGNLIKIQNNNTWDGNAFSLNTVSDNGYMTFIANETNERRAIGLNDADDGIDLNSIDFAFYLNNNGTFLIFENGANLGNFGAYATGDVFKIEINDGAVEYYHNGTLLYISGTPPLLPLHVDVSTLDVFATVEDVFLYNFTQGSYQVSATVAGTTPTYDWRLNGVSTGVTANTYTNTSLADGDLIDCIVTADLQGCAALPVTTEPDTVVDIADPDFGTFFIEADASSNACYQAYEEAAWTDVLNNELKPNNDLEKIQSNNNWNGDAFSLNSIINNNSMYTIANEIDERRAIGLSNTNGGQGINSIEYAFYLNSNGTFNIFENGANRGTFGVYVTGDTMWIKIESGVVNYYQNSTLLYISTIAPTLPLHADVSTRDVGATVEEVTFVKGSNGNFTAVTTNGGASPTYQWFLNAAPAGANQDTYSNGSLVTNDVITMDFTPDISGCSSSIYSSNSITMEEIPEPTFGTFYISADESATACQEVYEEVAWTDLNNNELKANNDIEKLQSNGNWDGDGFGLNSITNNNSIFTVVNETDERRAFGLSNANGGQGINSIEYALYLNNNATYNIYENGANRGNFGAYATGDTMWIKVESGAVNYYRNSTLVYISTIAPTLPLHADISTRDVGATLEEVTYVKGFNGDFTAYATGAGASPTYQWYLNAAPVGANSDTYSNTTLVDGDVVTCEITPDLTGCSSTIYPSNSVTVNDIPDPTFGTLYVSANGSSAACKEVYEEVAWTDLNNNELKPNNYIEKLQSNGNWNGDGFGLNSITNNNSFFTVVNEIDERRAIGLSNSNGGQDLNSIDYAFYLTGNGTFLIYENGANRGNYGTYATGDTMWIKIESGVVNYYRNSTLVYISTVAPTLPLHADISTRDIGATVEEAWYVKGFNGDFTATVTGAGASPTYQWTLNGGNVGPNASVYTNSAVNDGDVVTCIITPDLGGCSSATYESNEVVINDIPEPIFGDLYITANASVVICGYSVADVVWTDLQNNQATGNDLLKIQNAGDNGDAMSYNVVRDNGYMETTITQINTVRSIGLSTTNDGINRNSIDYAFYLNSNGTYNIFENGANRGNFGAYSNGEVFRISVESGVVYYYQNSALVYTSAVAPTLPMIVDVSTNSVGAELSDVVVANTADPSFTATVTNAGASPTYQWQVNGVNVGTNSPMYNAINLNDGDIVQCLVTPDLGGCATSQYPSNEIEYQEPSATTWIGTTADWHTPSNWSNGVPSAVRSADIVSGAPFDPVISAAAETFSLTVQPGASLTIGGANTLDLYGNWDNQGTLTANTSTVNLLGCRAATDMSVSTTQTFYNLVVNNQYNVNVLSGTHQVANNLSLTDGIVYNAGLIEILDDATATGASDNSHVDGQVRKTGNDAFIFPVGDDDNYQPIAISAPPLLTDYYTAQYFELDPDPLYDRSLLEPTIDHVSSVEYWILDRNPVSTSAVEVTLSWDANSGGVTNLAELRVARWDGALWTDEGNGGTTGTIATGTVVSAGPVTNFSPFTLASTTGNNPLPIELLSFTAKPEGDNVRIDWITATEVNSSHFEVERSSDGLYFEPIATVNAAGNSAVLQSYTTMDAAPINGVNYYRLRMVDLDGTVEYSPVKIVTFEQDNSLVLYPNPVANELTIQSDANVKSVQVYGLDGKLVLDQPIGARGVISMSLETLESGVYLVHINTGTDTVVRRMVKR